jgi:hypothetical protein
MAIAVVAMPKAEAYSGTVYMKVYNTKTNTEKVVVWKPDTYRFEKKTTLDVNDLTVKKIAKIFNTTELNVHDVVTTKPKTATWHHFEVTIGSDMYKQVKFL